MTRATNPTGRSHGSPGKTLTDAIKAEAARHGAGDAEAGLEKREPKDLAALVGVSDKLPGGQADALFEAYSRSYDRVSRRDVLVDAASEMSFPASDPPSYMGGASVVGAPDASTPAERVNTTVSDPAAVKPRKDVLPPKHEPREREASGGYNRPKI
jgi:hypothetical protein